MATNKNDNTTYTYKSVDGTTSTIRVGENGVTEDMIILLKAEDHKEELQELYQERHSSYAFKNAMRRYYQSGNENTENPIEQIPDLRADIEEILFSDEADESELLQRLCQAVEQLTDNQRDLIHELYGMKKKIVEIAREQDVSPAAIRDRRAKIFRRIEKLIKELDP